MDYQNYNQPTQHNKRRSQRMEYAALFLGIIAILGSCSVYPALICGSLAIVFALLSRGGEMTMTPRAKVGLTLGGIALAFIVFMILYVIVVANVYFDGIEDLYLHMNEYLEMTYSTLGIPAESAL